MAGRRGGRAPAGKPGSLPHGEAARAAARPGRAAFPSSASRISVSSPYQLRSAWPPPKGAGNFADETAKKEWKDWTIIQGYDDGYVATSPVGSFPVGASPYGCLDMAGNVWEWCSSAYKPYPYRADDGREGANDSLHRVFRGGSFYDGDRGHLAATSRLDYRPVNWVNLLGFRAARSSR